MQSTGRKLAHSPVQHIIQLIVKINKATKTWSEIISERIQTLTYFSNTTVTRNFYRVLECSEVKEYDTNIVGRHDRMSIHRAVECGQEMPTVVTRCSHWSKARRFSERTRLAVQSAVAKSVDCRGQIELTIEIRH